MSFSNQRLNGFILPWPRLAILSILLLAFGLRTCQLDSQSLRGDEAATVLYSALPVTELWELSRITDPHPPFYYLLLHPWQWLLGESAWVMRFAGVIASVLAVAALSALAQRTLHSPHISLLAAALLSLNPFQIWLAQDVRSYPFFTLLGLLSSGALWLALSRSTAEEHVGPTNYPAPNTRSEARFRLAGSGLGFWSAYIVLSVAGFYIHYYTVFLLAFQGLFVLVNLKKYWPRKWPWLASQLIIGLLIIPGLILAYNFVGQAAGGIETIATPALIERTFSSLLSGTTLSDGWGIWLSLLLAPVWLTGLVTLWRRDATTAGFWTLFFTAPVLGVIALSINRPFFKERFLIQAQPAFELLLAVGFLTLAGRFWFSATPHRTHGAPQSSIRSALPIALSSAGALLLLGANLVALNNYFTDPAYAKAPPWRLYNDYVGSEARPGDVMLTNFPEASVSYYSPNELPFYVTPAERDRPVEFRVGEAAQIANAYKRIWFLPLLHQGFDEQGDVLNWLDRHADRIDQIYFPAYNLNLYLSPPTIEAAMIEQPVTFAHRLQLRGYQVFDKEGASLVEASSGERVLPVEPEKTFNLSLYWQAGGPTPMPYTVFTHLIAGDGFLQTGQDNQPVWNSYPTTEWQPGEKITDKYALTVPAQTLPGDYHLRIGWYRAEMQERVPVLNDAGEPGTDHVLLSVIIRVE
ncbi:MAG TPA: glycosyltransferase family 39 protein [Anaerolineae bacterium]|jgi:hypothetical protein